MRSSLFLAAAAAALFVAAPAQAELAKCKMKFNMSGWSVVYKQMKGEGTVTCSNGQSAKVAIESHGAGATLGKSDVLDGEGTFSGVTDISEIFGTYAKLDTAGGATKGGTAQVMTKGEIQLAIAGSGRGWDVGLTLGGFTIKQK